MEKQFNFGFSKGSYLSLAKEITESIYINAITASSNTNTKIQTKGLLFNYSDDDRIGASASTENGYDNILMRTGTISRIFEYFLSVFSSKVMFPCIGNPLCESDVEIKAKFDYDKMQILMTGYPNDKIRRLIAEFTSLLAIRYMMAHELGHILNGHTNFVSSLYAMPKFDMIEKYNHFKLSDGSLTDYALDRRTLEMDADAFAASNGISNLISILNRPNDFAKILDCLENPLQIFELWTFAVHSLFMIMELEYPSNYSDKKFYLPNLARETLNLSAAKNSLEAHISRGYYKCNDKELSLISNYFNDGIGKAETFFNAYKHTSYCFKNDFNNDEIVVKECDIVLKHWNKKLRPKLEKYSRAILYNSTDMDF